jgi:hypothetical protein
MICAQTLRFVARENPAPAPRGAGFFPDHAYPMLKRFKTVPSIGTLIALSHGRRKGMPSGRGRTARCNATAVQLNPAVRLTVPAGESSRSRKSRVLAGPVRSDAVL